jgi:hypothetical protein
MTMTADELLRQTSRTDSGNMVSGDGHLLESRIAVTRSPTLGDPNAPAQVVGDMVSGMPLNDQVATPDVPPIEKVADSRTELPGGEGRQI